MTDLRTRTALVTGATSGVGMATGEAKASDDARFVHGVTLADDGGRVAT
jgi:NAD(P)-dependent dehydrogenase (short-subunit alcohol dehydrogenase family)